LRIVFIREPDRLTAYDLMDHVEGKERGLRPWALRNKGARNRKMGSPRSSG
jgi:hypothetical protein